MASRDSPCVHINQCYQGVRGVKTMKNGIESLIEEVEHKKEEIRTRFKAYLETLEETEAMLLGDLDAILESAKKLKEKQSKELKEITATEQFIQEQLKTSNNEMLKKHANTLNNDIRVLKFKFNEVPRIQVEWKHLNLCQLISEVCSIPHKLHTNYTNNRHPIMSSAKDESIINYWDCTFDQKDNNVYMIATFPNYKTKVLIFNRKLDLTSSFDITSEPLWSPWITTNSNYIFITSGFNCVDQVIRVSKPNKKSLVRVLPISPRKSFAWDEYLYSTSSDNVVYKFRISDLYRMEDILLKGVNLFGKDMYFSNATDLIIAEHKLYILFNSPTLRALCCFNSGGTLLREIITNSRRLERPTSFCFDNENNIIVADHKIRAFDHYGREIGSFEFSTKSFQCATAITFNPTTNHLLLLANHNDIWLNAY